MKENNKKSVSEMTRDDYLYHNTEMLLKKYRDVVWSIDVSVTRTQMNFEIEFGVGIEEFLDMSYAAGADLTGTDIEAQMRTIERNRKMLEIIDRALDVIRKKHKCGEMYYQILYLTYITSEEFENTSSIVAELADLSFYMSEKTYFKKKKEAILLLSNILWGFTSKESEPICDELLKKNGE